jgi:membrane peptidoglycan carboxypeptidase
MSSSKRARERDPGREALENEFRAMFAERSETVRLTTAPYAAVRGRIAAARRKRRMRLGSAGVAFTMAVVGVGVWAAVPTRHHAAIAPTSPGQVQGGGPAKVLYADGRTEIPAGALRDDALNWLRANYTGSLAGLTVVTTFDQKAQTAVDATLDSGAVILDARDGAVLALGGAWNRPLPIADLMKPVLLAAAFQTEKFAPDTMVPLDTAKHPLYFPPGAKQALTYVAGNTVANWPPEAPTTAITDRDVTLRQAAEIGASGPFAQVELDADVGPVVLRDMAVSLGLPNDSQDLLPVPSLVLGVAKATPLNMATVDATLADGGVRRDPRMVGKLLGKGGRTVWTPPDKAAQVLSQTAAGQVTDVLHSALADGTTGTNVARQAIGADTWGMAAASGSMNAAWLAGAESHYVISVGVSREDQNGNLAPLDGGTTAGSDAANRGGPQVGSGYAGATWASLVQAVRGLG